MFNGAAESEKSGRKDTGKEKERTVLGSPSRNPFRAFSRLRRRGEEGKVEGQGRKDGEEREEGTSASRNGVRERMFGLCRPEYGNDDVRDGGQASRGRERRSDGGRWQDDDCNVIEG